MSVTSLAVRPDGRIERLFDLLDRTDYRIITTDEDREAVFRLRYDSYLREESIHPDFSRRLSDSFDDLENTTIFGIYLEEELVATIRASVGTANYSYFPGMEVFSDYLAPELSAGKIIVDSTRFAVRESTSRMYPSLIPYVVARVPWMVAEHFKADNMLAAVRSEHRAFYARVMEFKVVSGPGYYPKLGSPHFLMSCDYVTARSSVQRRHPVFRSTLFERRMLMEHQSLPTSPRLAEIPRISPMSSEVRSGSERETTDSVAAPA